MLNLGDVSHSSTVLVFDHSLGLVMAAATERAINGRVFWIREKGISSKYLDELGLSDKRVPVSLTSWDGPVACEVPADLVGFNVTDPLGVDHEWWRPIKEHINMEHMKEADTGTLAVDQQHLDRSNKVRRERQGRRREYIEELEKKKVNAFIGTISPHKSRGIDGPGRPFENARRCLDWAVRYVNPDGRFVLMSTALQVLVALQAQMLNNSMWVNVKVEELFTREHQVLPGRSHPLMAPDVSHTSGFILSAIRLVGPVDSQNPRGGG
eukprot:GHVN01095391.1.p1 GENE.GHVN01095391.1~~GHVN01095391.1.p1  ORF type:complete len:267 (-),score=40.73 GHVN01095391.1:909-1709(-)